MTVRTTILASVMALLLSATLSCAGAGPTANLPTTPDLIRTNGAEEAGHYLWAFYNVFVDPEKNEFEIIPVRHVEEHWNVLKFLEDWPGTNCVKVLGWTNLPGGTVGFDVQIRHPFTLANFTGFDVRGIAMFSGSHTFPVSGLTTSDRAVGDGELVNADGYTTLYNPTTAGSGPGGYQGYYKGRFSTAQTPNALLNGYKRHISSGLTNTRNALYAGGAVTETYELDMPDGTMVFAYAVDACWAPPTTKPVTDPMTDFPPDANCPEPWKIEIAVTDIGQGLTDEGGSAILTIDVYDWQGKTSHFAPIIECTELFDGTLTGIWKEDGADFTRFETTIQNEKIAPQGEYRCLFGVEDTENATAPDWLDLTAYQVVILEVGEFIPTENQPPTAAAHAEPSEAQANQPVQFYDDSTDPDGYEDIEHWEWDFTFDPLDGFNPGVFDDPEPEITYPDPGVYRVQLRVTDSVGHQDMLDDPLIISVAGEDNYPPTACADVSNPTPSVDEWIQFFDCSTDPDGYTDIVTFAWEMDGDNDFNDKFGTSFMWHYDEGGDFEVQHRVIDSEGHQDDLDEPLIIEVNGPPIAAAEASVYEVTLGELVTLTNLSYDDDGNGAIEEVYWDMNGNDEYDDPEDIQDDDEVEVIFYEGGIHYIGLKVVDEWGLEAELDPKLAITVHGFDPFCVRLIDQWNSADSLYGTRTFNYFQGHISELGGLEYKDPDGPWDFTVNPPAQPAICEWLLPDDPEVSTPAGIWPDADFFFKEAAPVSGGTMYVPHRFDFTDAENGDLVLQGQWQASSGSFKYGETFDITHPICHPWFDSGAGSGDFMTLDIDITWSMETLGTGPAIFTVGGEPTILNCMLIRHHMSFVDTEYGLVNFSLLNYQWIDSEGNEVAFMQADNGLTGNNFSGNNYTGEVICRSLVSIN